MVEGRGGPSDPFDRVGVLALDEVGLSLYLIEGPEGRFPRGEANGLVKGLYGPIWPTQKVVGDGKDHVSVYAAGVQSQAAFGLNDRFFLTILRRENPALDDMSVVVVGVNGQGPRNKFIGPPLGCDGIVALSCEDRLYDHKGRLAERKNVARVDLKRAVAKTVNSGLPFVPYVVIDKAIANQPPRRLHRSR